MKPKSNPANKFIVSKFIDSNHRNWPRDIKMAKKLTAKYPEFKFWEYLNPVLFETMAQFFTDKCQAWLDKEYKKFKFELPEINQYNIDDKVGKDKEIENKPKSIMDFLE